MRHSCILVAGLLCGFLSTVIGSYDGGYPSAHDDDYYEPSYPATPIVHSQHHGHSAGSYYHYHVPLVGQQHYQPAYHQQDHSHYLWPLLLLLALPLLFLPLLPLLLLPLGLSLLALLAPGGMMMMMMMMMMGGGMMMRTDSISGRAFSEMRTFGEVLLLDMTSLLSKYARSLDLDQCPQRIACEMGATIFPQNNSTGSDSNNAKAFSNFIVEQYFPKGKIRRSIKQFEKAFWSGSSSLNSCKAFTCQPTFKMHTSFQEERDGGSEGINGTITATADNQRHQKTSFTTVESELNQNVNYIYPHLDSKVNAGTLYNNNPYDEQEKKATTTLDSPLGLKTKRSHFTRRHGNFSKNSVERKVSSYWDGSKKKPYFENAFGTPIVKSK